MKVVAFKHHLCVPRRNLKTDTQNSQTPLQLQGGRLQPPPIGSASKLEIWYAKLPNSIAI